MSRVVAIVCKSDGFLVTVVSGTDVEALTVEEEHKYQVPASLGDRGEQLGWMFDTATDLFQRLPVDLLIVRKSEGDSAQGRHETEGVIRLAAHRHGVRSETRIKIQVRAAFGGPTGSGAYEQLLKRPDAAARTNADLRHLFLYASAGARALSRR